MEKRLNNSMVYRFSYESSAGAGGGSSDSVAIGYNVGSALSLASSIKEAYDSFVESIPEEWNTLVSEMQKHWIGYDEQSFEKMLASRINELAAGTFTLAKNSILTIEEMIVAWANFQRNNLLEGTESLVEDVTIDSYNFEQYIPKDPGEVVSMKKRVFTTNDSMGLLNTNSGNTLQIRIDTFHKNIKDKALAIASVLESNKAFFGREQASSFESYYSRVFEIIGDIASAVKDFYDVITDLTTTQYGQASSDVSSELLEAKSTLNSEYEKNFTNRWDTE